MMRWADLGQMLTQPHYFPHLNQAVGRNKDKVMGQDKDKRDHLLTIIMAKQVQLGAHELICFQVR